MPSLLTVVADEILHWTRSQESFLLPKGAWNTHGTTGPLLTSFVRHVSCRLGCYSGILLPWHSESFASIQVLACKLSRSKSIFWLVFLDPGLHFVRKHAQHWLKNDKLGDVIFEPLLWLDPSSVESFESVISILGRITRGNVG